VGQANGLTEVSYSIDSVLLGVCPRREASPAHNLIAKHVAMPQVTVLRSHRKARQPPSMHVLASVFRDLDVAG
jgi:hypothetical protein